ncbi:hypothetical protein GCM10022393_20800 [Aquimarina addita]|uniref:Uncharacterized protein n=1 Tax=Aquimarina addita TaxID=870485 RepID=A0ABP6UM42_9FLAO
MNNIIIIFSFCISSLLNTKNETVYSECYSYHTPHYYALFVKEDHIVFQHTVKDPNAISYVSREEIVLDSINTEGFKILGEDSDKILFSTLDGCFIAEKELYEIEEYGVSKVANIKEITQIIGADLICRNGIWYYLMPEGYSSKVIEKEIKNVPKDLELFKSGIVRDGILVKNDEAVYIFDRNKLTFKKIPQLRGEDVQFVKASDRFNEGFLYDNDTCYFIGFDELTDYTNQFRVYEEFKDFANAEIVKHLYGYSIDTKDGIIWLYLRHSIIDKNGRQTKIVPIRATYTGKNKTFITFEGKVYDDASNLLKGYQSIDMSMVENSNELEKLGDSFYSDGKNSYVFNYDQNKFEILKSLPGDVINYPSIDTYGNMTSSFYADHKQLYFVSHPDKITETYEHNSTVKDLKLAYAYDDNILIENKEIENIADWKSIQFLGSTVRVISPCDGGHGQFNVEIDVYYFFMDANGVYVYNSSRPKMRKIGNQQPKNSKIDDYDYLEELMNTI